MYATRNLHAWARICAPAPLLWALGVGAAGLGCSGKLTGEDATSSSTTTTDPGGTVASPNLVGATGGSANNATPDTPNANTNGSSGAAGTATVDSQPPAQPGPPQTAPTIPQVPNVPPANPSTDAGTQLPDPPIVEPVPPAVPVCKRGIAIARSSLSDAALRPGIAWWYNWGSGMQQSAAGLDFAPMVWGAGFDVIDNIPQGAQFLLGFNEPNFFAQANLSASEAAALWPQVEQIAAARNLELVSPGVNFCGDDTNKTGPCHDTNPVDYLTDFFAACSNCKVDHVAVHWYNCDGASLTWYIDQFKQFGKPIWLTEFACAYDGDTSVAGQEAYMREALPLLEGDPQVARYSWFSGNQLPNARLINDDGTLTSLGQLYASLPQENCL